MKFGEQLQRLRRARGINQRDLAAMLEMDAAYLSRIENDQFDHLPSRETVERIVSALNLTPNDSDSLHVLARKIPADVEMILFEKPSIMRSVRSAVNGKL